MPKILKSANASGVHEFRVATHGIEAVEVILVVLKAFRVSAHGTEGITFATTRARARWAAVRSARDAGYETKFSDVTVKRAPEYDNMETSQGRKPVPSGACFIPEHLRRKV
jgi:hypothetical protein